MFICLPFFVGKKLSGMKFGLETYSDVYREEKKKIGLLLGKLGEVSGQKEV